MTEINAPLFSLEEVSFAYRASHWILEKVSLSFEPGVFHALIGPNGAGKSTLLGLLSGRLAPTRGRVLFKDQPVAAWNRKTFARHVAVVPQREESVFDFTVQELVLMGRFAFQTGPFGFETSQDYDVVQQALEATDVLHLAQRPISALSGGERQRALVARALAQEPEVLLLDEPNSALDPLHQKHLMDLFLSLNRERSKTVLLISHDLSLVGSYSQKVAVLDGGRIIFQGSTAEAFQDDFLSRIYKTPIGVHRVGDDSVLVGLLR